MSVHDWTYAGFLLTGVDEDGVRWTVEKSDGWTSGPGVRLARIPKAQQDGDWREKPNRAARDVTLAGKCWAPNHAALERATRRFAALPVSGVLAGVSEGVELTADVTLLDAPALSHSFPTVGVWQLAVTSPDPLLYGPATFGSTTLGGSAGGHGLLYPLTYPLDYGLAPGVTPGAIEVQNTGTTAYWPTLRIDGAVTNPVVQMVETGDWVRYEGTVEPDQWLDVDCGNRRILLNGQVSVRNRVTSSGKWLAVPEGGGSLTWSADTYGDTHRLSVWGHESAWH